MGFKKNVSLLFDDYKKSTTAWVTGTFSTISWILFGVTGRIGFAAIALLILTVPPITYYYIFGPFGIEIDYTPTRESQDGKVPDKVSERKNEAILIDGSGSIFIYVLISERLNSFGLQFYSPPEISVELIDLPLDEHSYDRKENVLSGEEITQHKFSIGLDITVEHETDRRRDFSLKFREAPSKRTIEEITLIDT